MKVSVYRNLHNGLISIKSDSCGLVLGHAKSVDIVWAKFVVHESGRQRVLKDKKKNVHAYVKGILMDVRGFKPYRGRWNGGVSRGPRDTIHKVTVVSYNPYKAPHFVIKGTGDKVSKASLCTVSSDGTIAGYGIE